MVEHSLEEKKILFCSEFIVLEKYHFIRTINSEKIVKIWKLLTIDNGMRFWKSFSEFPIKSVSQVLS